MNDSGESKQLKAILLSAEQFRRASIVLHGNEWDPAEEHDLHLTIPQFVLEAFACELYLKFLFKYMLRKDPPRSHNLEDLFNLIPVEPRSRIVYLWENPKPSQAMHRKFIEEMSGKPFPKFSQILRDSSHSFQKMRYSYSYPKEELGWPGGDLMECTRWAIFEDFAKDFSEVRLPLPPNAMSKGETNIKFSCSPLDERNWGF